VRGKALTLVRNRYFRSWSQSARPNGYPDEIVWRVYRNLGAATRDVLDGKADVLRQAVPPDAVARLAATHPRQLHFVPQLATTFVFLNTRVRPFDDVRVRRAINYAIDRREVANLHGGAAVAQPTCQVLPPLLIGFRRYCHYTADADATGEWKAPDVEKARALLAASGTRGDRVVVWTFSYFHREALYLVALLRRLGYRARLHEVPPLAAYFPEVMRAHDVQAGFGG
jgi:peptide/nickel transport system substrate-binding protein